MVATIVSIPPEDLLLDNIRIPLKDLIQVLGSVYQKNLVKKTHLLTLLQTRSKDNHIYASDVCAILIVDFVKCRDKLGDNASDNLISPTKAAKSLQQHLPTRKAALTTTKSKIDAKSTSKSPQIGKTSERAKQTKSALKSSQKPNEKTLQGRSMTPSKLSPKKTTFEAEEVSNTKKHTARPTLWSLTSNQLTNRSFDTTHSKLKTTGKPSLAQTTSVFLGPENQPTKTELAAAIKVRDEFEYHLNKTVPKYEEYKKKLDEEKSGKRTDVLKDKGAMM